MQQDDRSVFKILLLTGDPVLRDLLAEQFSAESDLDFKHIAEGGTALQLMRDVRFDLILADTVLSDGPGDAFCHSARAFDPDIPLLLLIAPRDDETLYADAGASEILRKPLRWAALLARLRDHLGQAPMPNGATAEGPFVFKSGGKLLVDKEGREIRLTEKEADILRYLLETRDQATDRQTLLRAVWGYHPDITTHTLETHIYRLRQKLEVDPADARILITEAGGYRLVL